MSTAELTDRQAEVLDFIRRYIADHGYPPTLAEMADAFGIRQTAIQGHLKALQREGCIERDPKISRAIRIVERRAEASDMTSL